MTTTKETFMQAYILQRAGAHTGSITSGKLVASAANVWQELQYELGNEERPQAVSHDEDGVVITNSDETDSNGTTIGECDAVPIPFMNTPGDLD